MHHLLGCKGYDHIDRNPLNNRRNNLRPATHLENMRNRGISSNNTSGVTGVYWYKAQQKWSAEIMINKEKIRLYYGDNKNEAIRTRLEAEAKYFGEFAPQQNLFEQYNIK